MGVEVGRLDVDWPLYCHSCLNELPDGGFFAEVECLENMTYTRLCATCMDALVKAWEERDVEEG